MSYARHERDGIARWSANAAERARVLNVLQEAPLREEVVIYLGGSLVIRGRLTGSGVEFANPEEIGRNDNSVRGVLRLQRGDGTACEVDALDVMRMQPRPRGQSAALKQACAMSAPKRREMMPDDLSDRGPQDRSRISMQEDHEVRYWTKALNVSKERLAQLVKQVGNSVEAVKRKLG
jgi:hypothetical protein